MRKGCGVEGKLGKLPHFLLTKFIHACRDLVGDGDEECDKNFDANANPKNLLNINLLFVKETTKRKELDGKGELFTINDDTTKRRNNRKMRKLKMGVLMKFNSKERID
ncbi:CLUMA_CG007527, isoform A [Clunio marinus]|uniref:CLUMA_CG007527, isoform A n=1 Tax=Clunio marinus TaxID=568069 RepID=A0A1J1I2K7_9DIPT|nr:CLUMA_CG007527, isoform A [Clunio marinus]